MSDKDFRVQAAEEYKRTGRFPRLSELRQYLSANSMEAADAAFMVYDELCEDEEAQAILSEFGQCCLLALACGDDDHDLTAYATRLLGSSESWHVRFIAANYLFDRTGDRAAFLSFLSRLQEEFPETFVFDSRRRPVKTMESRELALLEVDRCIRIAKGETPWVPPYSRHYEIEDYPGDEND